MSAEDVRTLEECADELMRRGSAGHAVKLWALALTVRRDLNMEGESRFFDFDKPTRDAIRAEWNA